VVARELRAAAAVSSACLGPLPAPGAGFEILPGKLRQDARASDSVLRAGKSNGALFPFDLPQMQAAFRSLKKGSHRKSGCPLCCAGNALRAVFLNSWQKPGFRIVHGHRTPPPDKLALTPTPNP
jgi:hypothetical protein